MEMSEVNAAWALILPTSYPRTVFSVVEAAALMVSDRFLIISLIRFTGRLTHFKFEYCLSLL
jgi:hypothetical protein